MTRAWLTLALGLLVLPRMALAQTPPQNAQQPAPSSGIIVQADVGQPQQPPQPVAPPPPAMPPVAIQPMADGQPAPVQVTGPVTAACPLAPCQLPLVPGTYQLTVQGPGGFNRMFNLPGLPAMIGYRQRHTGRLVAGIIELAIGGPVALTGLVLTGYSFLFFTGSSVSTLVGVVVLAAGVVALAVGIPLTIVGALNIARSGPQLDVRPGGMMVGAARARRNRAWLMPTSGVTGDGYAGGVINTFGVAF